ncbi:permease [Candidatus Atribacteria bacterium RBG_19FT_COMBO_35_14]|uniref:Permease n=1 Tax=Candidatus Sediminicultor quintus TaxID=1797291 RepID=A0A1F5A6B2_9BACT|nr:MAG: permease [Candidatus Atribacteria bacterium RBG_19FT_COMBO_35_14]OGD32705.1 MAG: permease [Candidatus Atribacteria bacterium RBG_16_35_8]
MNQWIYMGGGVIRKILLKGGPVVAMLFLIIYLAFATPHFFAMSNFLNITRQSSINAILAIGQTMVIIGAGIDLSVGAVLALSASMSAVAVSYWGLNMAVGILLGLGTGALTGFITGVIITKGRIPDFVATLAMMTTARGLALILTQGLPVPSHFTALKLVGYLPAGLIWLGSGDILGVPVPALITVAITILGWMIMTRTTLGRAIYAVGGNREAARISGINFVRTKIITYTIMGLLAGVAGIVLTGRLNSANALMADGAELQSIAAVVIGGTNLFGGEGGVVGSLIGAFIMGILGNGLNLLNVSAFWQRVILGLIIISVVVFDQWRRRRFVL